MFLLMPKRISSNCHVIEPNYPLDLLKTDKLSAIMNCSKSNNILNDSDWRRAFGFFLNFSTLSSEDISAALEEYKSAFESGFAAKPNPKYKEKVFTPIEGYFPDCQYNDICYSLVNIFCNG